MAKDVTGHDASTNLTETFKAARGSRIVMSVRWSGIIGATTETYKLQQSMIDSVTDGDDVPAIPTGVPITNGADSATVVVTSPADELTHLFVAGGISAGTIDIKTKVLYTND